MLYNELQCIRSMAIEFGPFIADDWVRQRCHGRPAAPVQGDSEAEIKSLSAGGAQRPR